MALSIAHPADTGRVITRQVRGTDMKLIAFHSTTINAPVIPLDQYDPRLVRGFLTLDEAQALSEALGELVAAVR